MAEPIIGWDSVPGILQSAKRRRIALGPKSLSLFHFTKSLDSLRGIFREGFWPFYCAEDVGWIGYKSPFRAVPMVSFCDIPLTRIAEHTDFYGDYGLGMKRDWGVQNQLNPLLYIAGDNPLKNALKFLSTHLIPRGSKLGMGPGMNEYFDAVSYVKPVEGTMHVNGASVTKDFFSESEWRYLAHHPNLPRSVSGEVVTNAAQSKTLSEMNIKARLLCTLKFTPQDVSHVFVKTESDIPVIMDFLRDLYTGSFPNADVNILMSRVTSLASLRRDF